MERTIAGNLTARLTEETRRRCSTALADIASRPLRLRPEFPAAARRWEAWWRFEADRPLLLASAPKDRSIRWDKAFDLLDRPAEWLAVRRRQAESLHCVGEALPSVRVDLGPVATAAFLGAPLHFAEAEQTSWQDPVIDSWEAPPSFRLEAGNRWLRTALGLLDAVAADAAGSYLVCLPDLTGSVDVLASMRGSERLCLDMVEHRGEVSRAALRIVDAWEAVFVMAHEAALARGAGLIQWLGCWSDEPYTIPTCDFNALIGPRDFGEVCLPSLALQARRAGRCVFHLDGPDAARHVDALIAEPSITALQYTPGAGTPSAAAKLPMLRRILSARKPLVLFCPQEEVERLAGELDPRGLALIPEGVADPREADELARRVGV